MAKLRRLGLFAVAAAITLACHRPGWADDASRFRNLKYFCTETGIDPSDGVLLGCINLRDDADLLREGIHQYAETICAAISSACRLISNRTKLDLYSNYSTLLGCAEYGYQCGGSETNQLKAGCDQGNINPVVSAIEQIENAGGRVSNALKRAIRAYVEICAVNNDVGAAMARANAELTTFYNNRHIGCAEAGFEGPVNECTAAVDRQWQYFSTRAVLDWTNSHSVVSQVTIATVRRWAGAGQ